MILDLLLSTCSLFSMTGGADLSRSCAERVWASFLGPVVFWPLAPGAMAWANGCGAEAIANPSETADGSPDFVHAGMELASDANWHVELITALCTACNSRVDPCRPSMK